ncbi:MAG: DUF262 domain-containing protein [Ignavibacteria bacterium]
MNKIGVATNKKLIDIFNMLRTNDLILKPYFQRKLVWNDSHKEAFISTILQQLPFPEVYFADGPLDLEAQKSKTLVVDGQQRLSTIYQYITNSDEFKVKKIKKFSSLSEGEKTEFFDYLVVVRDLGRLSDDEIIEIFKRINSVQYALNSMEINNALYQGEFINLAKDIVEKNNLYKKLDIFSENEYSRMQDLEFVLLIMSTIEEGGYFTGGKEIETYTKKFDGEYPNRNDMNNDLTQAVEIFVTLSVSFDSIWYRKTSLFTLLVELIKFKRKFGAFPDITGLKRLLISFEEQLMLNKDKERKDNVFAEYYYYTFQGTASRTGRNKRGEVLSDKLLTLK